MPDLSNNQYQSNLAQTAEPAPAEPHRRADLRQPFSVDSYADGLMDELFEDVEDVLDRGISLPVEPLRAAPRPNRAKISVPFVNETPFSLANAIAHRQATWQGSTATDSLIRQVPGQLTAVPAKPARPVQRLLLLTTGAAAVTAFAVWGVTHGWGQRLLAIGNPPTVISAPAPAPVSADSQFSDYMQRSLEAITRVATSPSPAPGAKLPIAVTAAPTPLSTLARPALAPMPAGPVQVSINDPTRNELTQILAQLNSVLQRLYPAANQAAAPPTPPIRISPLQSPIAAVTIPPALQRTLTGVLQAQNPDQSAALFEMNGVTQRYYPGESIGTSGWILVEVKNNQAVIRRNGDVKTIEAGQKLE